MNTMKLKLDIDQAIRLRKALRSRIRKLSADGNVGGVEDLQPLLDQLNEFVPADEFPRALVA